MAFVDLKKDEQGNNNVVAYILIKKMSDLNTSIKEDNQMWVAKINEMLALKLPAYMLPKQYFFLEKIARDQFGGVDKTLFPEINFLHLIKREYIAPLNETQKILITIWQDILKIEKVGFN